MKIKFIFLFVILLASCSPPVENHDLYIAGVNSVLVVPADINTCPPLDFSGPYTRIDQPGIKLWVNSDKGGMYQYDNNDPTPFNESELVTAHLPLPQAGNVTFSLCGGNLYYKYHR